jgi:predicted dehydrogenase
VSRWPGVTGLWLGPSGPPIDDAGVKVGILGCGHVSDQYFEGCRRFAELELVACADLDVTRAEQKAAKHGVPRACTPEELFADPALDLVVNLTPPLAHAQASLVAVDAGKHVWSEKPLAATLDAALELVAAADHAGVRLGCAPDTFLGGGLQTSIKLVDDGWIGAPVAAAAMVSEHGYEHFHPQVASFYGPGGGPALDLGPYYVTALVAMLGPVARVTAFARATFPERTVLTGPRFGERIAVQVPTHVTGALELESGPLVTVLMSWDLWATHLPHLEVYGTEGSLAVANPDLFDGTPRVRRAGPEEIRQPPPEPGELPWTSIPLTHAGDVGRGIGIAEMADAIERGEPHRAGPELACHVLEVLCAMQRAAEEGTHVDIQTTCARPAPLPVGFVPGQAA